MKILEKHPDLWADKGQWLIVLRVGLGLSLFVRGISFLRNSVLIDQLLSQTPFLKQLGWLSIPIVCVHLFCGLLIIIGLFTRWAVLLQIPVLISGLIVTNMQRGVFAFDPEVGFGFIILLLLLFFFIEGGGPLSCDKMMRKTKD
jgi:putative oxidoreductase